MNWIELIDKVISIVICVGFAYFYLRERIIKIESRIKSLEKEVLDNKNENTLIYQDLKNSIDRLTGTINKLEKSIVRLETLNEK
jgi:predicted  nucleic acid-binding Zn-ribbon protein